MKCSSLADHEWSIMPPTGPAVATIPQGQVGDARLIAAAPLMLEALQVIDSSASIIAALESCGERKTLLGISKLASAAIAKATAEST